MTDNKEFRPPAQNELEVSLFGPGYGESVLLHIGNGQWIVVDSCIGPSGGDAAALTYLERIGINAEQSVVLVVITHWHDDHVRGIRAIVKKCASAKVAISAAFQQDEFLNLASVLGRRPLPETGLDELIEVFRLLQERSDGALFEHPVAAIQDRLLLTRRIVLNGDECQALVHSLSPTDPAVLRACGAFAALYPKEGDQPKRVVPPTRNDASVVLWVEVGDHKMLLGADLENDLTFGWSFLIDNSAARSGTAEVYKVSHHGAESGHDPRVWDQILSPNPMAVLSPWTLAGHSLPTAADSERLNKLTTNAYITAPITRRRLRLREHKVQQMVESTTRIIEEVGLGWGHVRLRHLINDVNDNWRVELFGDARPLA